MEHGSASKWTIPRRRRYKARTACRLCRTRKSGCDGGKPSCGTCRSRGKPDQCVYEQYAVDLPKKGLSKGRNIDVQSTDASTRKPSALNTLGTVENATRPIPIPRLGGISPLPTGRTDSKLTVDGNRRQSGGGTGPEENHFGFPSTHSFINHVTKAIDPGDSTFKSPGPSNNILNDPIGFPVIRNNDSFWDINAASLPEKTLTDSLLQAYWKYAHPIFPVLHRPSFSKSYSNIRQMLGTTSLSNWTNNDILLLATLNVVLAIGCQRCDECPAEYRKRDAETLYRRSVRLVSAETWDLYSMEVAQLFLLRTIYLQYTSFASRCWSTLGIVQRVANGLGLNRDAPELNQVKREMRRRVWHTIMLMDCIAAYTFGWPATRFEHGLVPLPQAIDDEYLSETGEGYQPKNKPSILDFFVYYIQMSFMAGEYTENLYISGRKLLQNGSVTLLTQYTSAMPNLCLRLDEANDILPHHLRNPDEAVDECFKMQGLAFRVRTLYIRLAVLRPCLVATIGDQMTRSSQPVHSAEDFSCKSLTTQLLDGINELCVSTAYMIISQVYNNMKIMCHVSSWHTLRVTFGSATVLLAATLLPNLRVNLNLEPAKSSWEQAIAIFQFYVTRDISAQGGIQALWDYRQKFETANVSYQQSKPAEMPSPATPDIQPPSAQNPCRGNSSGDMRPSCDEQFANVETQAFSGDFSQAFHDWNWMDLDTTDFLFHETAG